MDAKLGILESSTLTALTIIFELEQVSIQINNGWIKLSSVVALIGIILMIISVLWSPWTIRPQNATEFNGSDNKYRNMQTIELMDEIQTISTECTNENSKRLKTKGNVFVMSVILSLGELALLAISHLIL